MPEEENIPKTIKLDSPHRKVQTLVFILLMLLVVWLVIYIGVWRNRATTPKSTNQVQGISTENDSNYIPNTLKITFQPGTPTSQCEDLLRQDGITQVWVLSTNPPTYTITVKDNLDHWIDTFFAMSQVQAVERAPVSTQ